MKDTMLIKESLHAQGLPTYKSDIDYIKNNFHTITLAENALKTFPTLNKKVPITVVDKRLIL